MASIAEPSAERFDPIVSLSAKIPLSFQKIYVSGSSPPVKAGVRASFLGSVYWDNEGIWSKGFFVATVGFNETLIRKYVEMQEKEDTGQAKLEF